MSTESLLSPLEIAAVTSTVVFGITCLQCYMYYSEHSTNDTLLLKCLVGVLMVLETLDATFISHALYFYTVKSFEDPEMPVGTIWSFSAETIVSVFSSTITQCFFAIRIYYLDGRHRFLPILIAVMAILLLISTTCMNVYLPTVNLSNNQIEAIAIINFILPAPYSKAENDLFVDSGSVRIFVAVVCDITISMGTIYHLRKRRTPLGRTDRAINKLIRYTLNTGLLTTFFGIITVVAILTHRYFLFYTPFYFNMTRLYACSLISILNSREAVQKELPRASCNTETANVIFTTIGFD